MEKTVALLEEGVLGMHEGQHLGRETTARSEQVLGQSEYEESLSPTNKSFQGLTLSFPKAIYLLDVCLSSSFLSQIHTVR